MNLLDLNFDVLEKIFRKLTLHELYNCFQVNKSFQYLVKELVFEKSIDIRSDNVHYLLFILNNLNVRELTLWNDISKTFSKEIRHQLIQRQNDENGKKIKVVHHKYDQKIFTKGANKIYIDAHCPGLTPMAPGTLVPEDAVAYSGDNNGNIIMMVQPDTGNLYYIG